MHVNREVVRNNDDVNDEQLKLNSKQIFLLFKTHTLSRIT